MAGSYLTGGQYIPHLEGQRQQPERIGYGRPVLAHALGDSLVGLTELFVQALVPHRLVNRVQVLALQVLNQGELEHFEVVDRADDRRDLFEAGELRRPQPALAHDHFIAVAPAPHHNRLQHAVRLYRRDQFVEVLLGLCPGLKRVGPDFVNPDGPRFGGHRGLGLFRYYRPDSLAQRLTHGTPSGQVQRTKD